MTRPGCLFGCWLWFGLKSQLAAPLLDKTKQNIAHQSPFLLTSWAVCWALLLIDSFSAFFCIWTAGERLYLIIHFPLPLAHSHNTRAGTLLSSPLYRLRLSPLRLAVIGNWTLNLDSQLNLGQNSLPLTTIYTYNLVILLYKNSLVTPQSWIKIDAYSILSALDWSVQNTENKYQNR